MKEVTQQLDALLSLSRTRESPPVQELELAQWLPEASESLLAGGKAGRVRWSGGPARLVAPPGAARIVFGNLLQNALLADPAGEIVVTVAPGRVTVEDRGPGLKPEVLPRVFEPGFRGREGGSGMGLYIARAIADRYGWSLSMQNREGGGARAQWTFG
jgi:signal transduction histidine kinase